ncbi:Homodimeric type [Neofusicoccum parvum]|uniref:Homodimeric type n=1 Tax=Neofusicoccum parvum TaxID=310453 RepID=A0ACB5SE09_9PEZI|nr:Homodimeric type [Neofusicoccum parvum]
MPEQIGYLKAIGLDYGWGPTACIEWLLEHIHIWMGIPWWAAIVVTAVAVRASLFPLFATTSDVTARQQALKDITDPLNKKMNEARIAGSTDLMMQARAELMAVYKQAGINAWKAFYAPVTQAVTGYCSWKLLRAMAALPVPGLETGGFLWLKDLTVADPFFIMPIAFGALIHLVSKAGGETGAMKQLSSLQRKFLLYILPSVAVIFTIAQPAAVQLSFFTASSLGMLQARILRSTAVRELLGLAPFVDQPGAQNQHPNIIDTTARVTSPGQLKWEPPTVQSSIAHAGKINEATVEKSPLDDLKKSYMETRKELKDFKDGIMKRAGFYQDNTQGRKQTKEPATEFSMPLDKFDGLELPAAADMHVHLRDGAMMETVTPTIRQGGVNTVYVMPNLVPPITTVPAALAYRARLQAIEPNVTFLMSLYLHPSITPETIIEAKKAGITGVKSYPAGVTTNSSAGVVDYAAFYPVFAEMERQDLVLNLHGELPASASPTTDGDGDITVLNAEERFLPTLRELHARFPGLRIILEHCTSAAAVAAVRACGPAVAATITAHHLYLTVDDVVGNAFHFCKPVAKLPADRRALLHAAAAAGPKFFFGTDSAPHPRSAKTGPGAAAGVFTQPYAVQLVVEALEKAVEKGWVAEEEVTAEALEGFLSGYGRKFYKVGDERGERVVVRRKGEKVVESVTHKEGEVEVVPFRKGEETWSVEWK